MKWDLIVSLLSDSRVRFLLGFVIVAIIFAVILIFIESSLRKKKVRIERDAVEDAPIGRMREFLSSERTPEEKLDFMDKTVKWYFGRIYGTPVNVDYSMLIEYFGKKNKDEEIGFCDKMFDSYYSDGKLTNSRVEMLGNLFFDIVNKGKKLNNVPKSAFALEKTGEFLNNRWKIIKKMKHRVYERRVQGRKGKGNSKRKKLVEVSKKGKGDNLVFEGGVASRIVNKAKKLH